MSDTPCDYYREALHDANRGAVMEDMLDALQAAQRELDALRAVSAAATARAETAEAALAAVHCLLAYIDAHTPPADETCDEPGITFLEAVRREMAQNEVQP